MKNEAANEYAIFKKWPRVHPDRLQLFSALTPNGVKISIMLEEIELPYEAHLVGLSGDQFSPEFLELFPNNKIPGIFDPNGPTGKPIHLFESGAILLYLAEKTGKLLPKDPTARFETIQWLMFQVGGVGPMFGQVGFFVKYGGKDFEDKRPRDRYLTEAKRLLKVMDTKLATSQWIAGDAYTIADIAIFPWVRGLKVAYNAEELLGFNDYKNVAAALERFLARPAVQRGLHIPKQRL